LKKWLEEDARNPRPKSEGISGRSSFARMLLKMGREDGELNGSHSDLQPLPERARDDYLADINQAQVGIGGAILFRDFARVYERDVLPTLAITTRGAEQECIEKSS
jgi:hypothetical protein